MTPVSEQPAPSAGEPRSSRLSSMFSIRKSSSSRDLKGSSNVQSSSTGGGGGPAKNPLASGSAARRDRSDRQGDDMYIPYRGPISPPSQTALPAPSLGPNFFNDTDATYLLSRSATDEFGRARSGSMGRLGHDAGIGASPTNVSVAAGPKSLFGGSGSRGSADDPLSGLKGLGLSGAMPDMLPNATGRPSWDRIGNQGAAGMGEWISNLGGGALTGQSSSTLWASDSSSLSRQLDERFRFRAGSPLFGTKSGIGATWSPGSMQGAVPSPYLGSPTGGRDLDILAREDARRAASPTYLAGVSPISPQSPPTFSSSPPDVHRERAWGQMPRPSLGTGLPTAYVHGGNTPHMTLAPFIPAVMRTDSPTHVQPTQREIGYNFFRPATYAKSSIPLPQVTAAEQPPTESSSRRDGRETAHSVTTAPSSTTGPPSTGVGGNRSAQTSMTSLRTFPSQHKHSSSRDATSTPGFGASPRKPRNTVSVPDLRITAASRHDSSDDQKPGGHHGPSRAPPLSPIAPSSPGQISSHSDASAHKNYLLLQQLHLDELQQHSPEASGFLDTSNSCETIFFPRPKLRQISLDAADGQISSHRPTLSGAGRRHSERFDPAQADIIPAFERNRSLCKTASGRPKAESNPDLRARSEAQALADQTKSAARFSTLPGPGHRKSRSRAHTVAAPNSPDLSADATAYPYRRRMSVGQGSRPPSSTRATPTHRRSAGGSGSSSQQARGPRLQIPDRDESLRTRHAQQGYTYDSDVEGHTTDQESRTYSRPPSRPFFHHRMPPEPPSEKAASKSQRLPLTRHSLLLAQQLQHERDRQAVLGANQGAQGENERTPPTPALSNPDSDDTIDLATVLAQGKALEEDRAAWRREYERSLGATSRARSRSKSRSKSMDRKKGRRRAHTDAAAFGSISSTAVTPDRPEARAEDDMEINRGRRRTGGGASWSQEKGGRQSQLLDVPYGGIEQQPAMRRPFSKSQPHLGANYATPERGGRNTALGGSSPDLSPTITSCQPFFKAYSSRQLRDGKRSGHKRSRSLGSARTRRDSSAAWMGTFRRRSRAHTLAEQASPGRQDRERVQSAVDAHRKKRTSGSWDVAVTASDRAPIHLSGADHLRRRSWRRSHLSPYPGLFGDSFIGRPSLVNDEPVVITKDTAPNPSPPRRVEVGTSPGVGGDPVAFRFPKAQSETSRSAPQTRTTSPDPFTAVPPPVGLALSSPPGSESRAVGKKRSIESQAWRQDEQGNQYPLVPASFGSRYHRSTDSGDSRARKHRLPAHTQSSLPQVDLPAENMRDFSAGWAQDVTAPSSSLRSSKGKGREMPLLFDMSREDSPEVTGATSSRGRSSDSKGSRSAMVAPPLASSRRSSSLPRSERRSSGMQPELEPSHSVTHEEMFASTRHGRPQSLGMSSVGRSLSGSFDDVPGLDPAFGINFPPDARTRALSSSQGTDFPQDPASLPVPPRKTRGSGASSTSPRKKPSLSLKSSESSAEMTTATEEERSSIPVPFRTPMMPSGSAFESTSATTERGPSGPFSTPTLDRLQASYFAGEKGQVQAQAQRSRSDVPMPRGERDDASPDLPSPTGDVKGKGKRHPSASDASTPSSDSVSPDNGAPSLRRAAMNRRRSRTLGHSAASSDSSFTQTSGFSGFRPRELWNMDADEDEGFENLFLKRPSDPALMQSASGSAGAGASAAYATEERQDRAARQRSTTWGGATPQRTSRDRAQAQAQAQAPLSEFATPRPRFAAPFGYGGSVENLAPEISPTETEEEAGGPLRAGPSDVVFRAASLQRRRDSGAVEELVKRYLGDDANLSASPASRSRAVARQSHTRTSSTTYGEHALEDSDEVHPDIMSVESHCDRDSAASSQSSSAAEQRMAMTPWASTAYGSEVLGGDRPEAWRMGRVGQLPRVVDASEGRAMPGDSQSPSLSPSSGAGAQLGYGQGQGSSPSQAYDTYVARPQLLQRIPRKSFAAELGMLESFRDDVAGEPREPVAEAEASEHAGPPASGGAGERSGDMGHAHKESFASASSSYLGGEADADADDAQDAHVDAGQMRLSTVERYLQATTTTTPSGGDEVIRSSSASPSSLLIRPSLDRPESAASATSMGHMDMVGLHLFPAPPVGDFPRTPLLGSDVSLPLSSRSGRFGGSASGAGSIIGGGGGSAGAGAAGSGSGSGRQSRQSGESSLASRPRTRSSGHRSSGSDERRRFRIQNQEDMPPPPPPPVFLNRYGEPRLG